MNRKALHIISSICSGQTVSALFLSYMLIGLYILPSAFTDAIDHSGLKFENVQYLKFFRIAILVHHEILNEEFKQLFISTELTAGVFEDLILLILIISIHFYSNSRTLQFNRFNLFKIRIAITAFLVDIIQTIAMVCIMEMSKGIGGIVFCIICLAVAKCILYSYILIAAFENWCNA